MQKAIGLPLHDSQKKTHHGGLRYLRNVVLQRYVGTRFDDGKDGQERLSFGLT